MCAFILSYIPSSPRFYGHGIQQWVHCRSPSPTVTLQTGTLHGLSHFQCVSALVIVCGYGEKTWSKWREVFQRGAVQNQAQVSQGCSYWQSYCSRALACLSSVTYSKTWRWRKQPMMTAVTTVTITTQAYYRCSAWLHHKLQDCSI